MKTNSFMNQKLKVTLIIAAVGLVVLALGYNALFGAPQGAVQPEQFVVGLNAKEADIITALREQGFIRSTWAFNFVLNVKNWRGQIQPGGYRLSKSFNAWQVAQFLTGEPALEWVVIPEGWRKEQIAEALAAALDWNDQRKADWVNKFTAMKYDYVEGVYFPDTYLIPKDEGGLAVAQRFINKFNEKFAPYEDKFTQANIKWTTALKIASLVQREAAGAEDMPLIAGIIWNRLNQGMKLDIDATVQYARGDAGAGWWAPIKPADKQIDSPYNTYLYKGLPIHPIANPGLEAIDAVLNSTQTDCLYYLHDAQRQIHCAKTYEEHQANIAEYLF